MKALATLLLATSLVLTGAASASAHCGKCEKTKGGDSAISAAQPLGSGCCKDKETTGSAGSKSHKHKK